MQAGPLGVEARAQQTLQRLGVGAAAALLHALADQEADHLFTAALEGLNLFRVSSQHGVDDLAEGVVATDLRQVAVGHDDGCRCLGIFDEYPEDLLSCGLVDRAVDDEGDQGSEALWGD